MELMSTQKLSEELQWRGFVNQTTFKDMSLLDEEQRVFYWGVDPSASSMTIGNLAAAMMARVFMKHGWKAVLLVGGATGMIGDPDGKKQERDLKTLEEIAKNKAGLVAQYQSIFGDLEFTVVDNYDWFKNINYLDFLRDIGKHVSITQMLDRSFVQDRIGEGGSGISYAEFSYSLIQGYDFVHLFREYGVTVQLAGADQWGNSISGVDLIRRVEGGKAHVYSCPLIVNKATGVKFGKSEAGAVWLDADATSVYSFYQFWLNVDDEGVSDYLKVYTDIQEDELNDVMKRFTENPSVRVAQKELAQRVTAIVHGESLATAAAELTAMLFGGSSIDSISPTTLELIRRELPTVVYADEMTIMQALVDGGLTSNNSEAKRLITGNAVSLNGQKLSDIGHTVASQQLYRVGKNRFLFVD